MRLQVGPIASSSVLAWVDYAREAIDDIVSDPFETPFDPAVLDAFRSYLDTWEREARRGDEFSWEQDIPAEVAEYQVHAFHQMVSRLAMAAELRGEALQPQEAEPFYQALVAGVIDALLVEGDAAAEYGVHLRSFWPGFADADVDAPVGEV